MPLFQSTKLAAELIQVEELLQHALRSRQAIVQHATTQLVLAGGKRIRPALTLLGAKYGPNNDPKVFKIAAAMELLHMATLVHDDIIDDSPLRRGYPTVQAQYGKEVAVFTGDWLLSKALLMLAEAKTGERMIELARTMLYICEGEIAQYASRYQRVSIYRYLKRIHSKTAALFGLCITAGAEQSQAPESTLRALAKYGSSLGMAFQIYDDLLDYTATSTQVGKPVGSDINSGIYTLPLLFALEEDAVAKKLQNLLAKLPCLESAYAIVECVAQTDAPRQCQDLLARYVARAVQAIEHLPDIEAKHILTALPESLFTK